MINNELKGFDIKVCSHCGKEIDTLYYFTSEVDDISYCQKCSDELLIFEDEINSFILREDYQDSYTDNELSDIETFKKEKLTDEEIQNLINYYKTEVRCLNAYLEGLKNAR